MKEGGKMPNLKLSGKHILLLLLYSPGETPNYNEPIIGRTRIMKMMFLFDKKVKKEILKDSNIELISFPEFFAWNYGPFSKDVFNDLEFFINNGFIEGNPLQVERSEIELSEYENWMEDYVFNGEDELLLNIEAQECFQLTENGKKFVAEKIYEKLSENQRNIIIIFKKSINKATLNAILRYVYLDYPDYTRKSKIKGRFQKLY